MDSKLYIRRSIIFLIIGLIIGYIISLIFALSPDHTNTYSNTAQMKLSVTFFIGYLSFSFYAGADLLYRLISNNAFVGLGCLFGLFYAGFVFTVTVLFVMPVGTIVSIPRFIINLLRVRKRKSGYY